MSEALQTESCASGCQNNNSNLREEQAYLEMTQGGLG